MPRHRWLSHAHWHDVESAVGRFTVPRHCWNSLTHWHNDKLAAGRTTMPRHCRPFPRLLVQRRRQGADDSGLLLNRRQWGADESALALLCNGGGGKANDRASG